ncbi:hypothetical protein NYE25_24530 [Paenibacillus sp. FSL E2-8871]|uniref:hypothetical protein n=1 Tax=Paenibacillus sp. FSL E2-8871 TaxID=2975326 RepID=UPI0030F54ADA
MINELFKRNNIKYIVSVDDCYGVQDETVELSELIDEIVENVSSYFPIIENIGKYQFDLGVLELLPENLLRRMITDWVETLDSQELELFGDQKGSQLLISEKDTLLTFFSELKDSEIITEYIPLDSIHKAKHFLKSQINEMWHPDENNQVLWLVDRDFGSPGSENEGLELLKEFNNDEYNWNIAILATHSTDDIEDENQFNKFLDAVSNLSTSKNLFWKINKEFIDKNNYLVFANEINYGLRRNYTYRITNFLTDALRAGIELAGTSFKNIEQSTFNNIVLNFSNDEGVSIVETLTRVLLVLTKYDLNQKISGKYEDIAKLISGYENLSTISLQENEFQNLSEVNSFRKMEKYSDWINELYYPVGFGDIFLINDEEYLFVSQPCDVTIRGGGDRKIKNGLLLKISDSKPDHESFVRLSYYKQGEQHFVILKDELQIDLDILDLCSLNNNGCAKVPINTLNTLLIEKDYLFSKGLKIRLEIVLQRLRAVYEKKNSSKDALQKLIEEYSDIKSKSGLDIADLIGNYKEREQETWEGYININNFKIEANYISYKVKRLTRLEESVTTSISFEHFTINSRIGLPGDYAKEYKTYNYKLTVKDPSGFFGKESTPLLPLPNLLLRNLEDKAQILDALQKVILQVAPTADITQLEYSSKGDTLTLENTLFPISIKETEYFCTIKKDNLKIPTTLIFESCNRFGELISKNSEILSKDNLFKKIYKVEKKMININEAITFKKTEFNDNIFVFEYGGSKLLTILATIEKIDDFRYELVLGFEEDAVAITSLIQ